MSTANKYLMSIIIIKPTDKSNYSPLRRLKEAKVSTLPPLAPATPGGSATLILTF
jgi:hypothetical protein